mgnify:CR=1 FL=1
MNESSLEKAYDFVIVGAGPNGVALASYLGKCGASVCVLEERTECGGACETQEPIPGVRIYPHAMLMYASPAPGFEQLELHKYGFRMNWDPSDPSTPANTALTCTDGFRPTTQKDMEGWAKLAGMFNEEELRERLRVAEAEEAIAILTGNSSSHAA